MAHNLGASHIVRRRRLKPLDRQVILLYLEGEPAAAIAEVTGLSAINVATKIHRIKRLLNRQSDEGAIHADENLWKQQEEVPMSLTVEDMCARGHRHRRNDARVGWVLLGLTPLVIAAYIRNLLQVSRSLAHRRTRLGPRRILLLRLDLYWERHAAEACGGTLRALPAAFVRRKAPLGFADALGGVDVHPRHRSGPCGTGGPSPAHAR
jgi:hypothetical protein